MKKSIISAAVVTALGLTASVANAATVTGLTVKDVGSNTANGAGNYSATLDGFSGAFQFKNNYVNVLSYNKAAPFTGDVGTGTVLGGPATNATGSFTTGFLFSGAPFVPFTYGGGMVADISAGVLTVPSLEFGGQFQSGGGPFPEFLLPPDSNFPLQVMWTEPTDNPGDFDVALRWGHIITTADDPSGMYVGFSAQWSLEGCASTVGNEGAACGASVAAVPVPAAAWLFGSGLMGMVGVARRRNARKS